MPNAELGRILDPSVLDSAPGARARFRLQIPGAWMAEGCDLDILPPRLLSCARCDGGGCDACERSGALAAPSQPEGRALRARVPPDSSEGVALRLVQPFGPEHPIEQILLEIRAGDPPSEGVTRIEPALTSLAFPTPALPRAPWILLALALLAAIAAVLSQR